MHHFSFLKTRQSQQYAFGVGDGDDNKLASLEATLVRNSAHSLTY